MKLPSNATNEEKEQFAYINGDVYTAKLYQEIIELQEQLPFCGEGCNVDVDVE